MTQIYKCKQGHVTLSRDCWLCEKVRKQNEEFEEKIAASTERGN
jgi:hypothetical protein